MTRRFHFALLLAAFTPAALADVQLFQISGGAEIPAPAVISFGAVDPGDSAALAFRLRNTGSAPSPVGALTLAGTAFVLVAAPVPTSLPAQATFDFTVSFQPPAAGSYSAVLQAAGGAVLLTGIANPALTFQMLRPGGFQPLTAAIDLGNVTIGSIATQLFEAVNQTSQPLLVPAIALNGAGFSFSGTTPSGMLLQPLATATFAVAFTPTQPGPAAATLSIGSRNYSLQGTAVAPALPKGSIHLNLGSAESAQQGAITVTLDAPYYSDASGTIAMSFTPSAAVASSTGADPSIGFASGGLVAPFTVFAGGTQASFGGQASVAFSTGTTAGTITFTLTFGSATTQQTVTIAPAAVGLNSVTAVRQSGAITVQVSGFDNTRTAGKLTFTFYDAAGNAIAPGVITADSTQDFATYFHGSTLGGAFALTATFPVTGGASSQVAAFDVAIANSVGTARSARVNF